MLKSIKVTTTKGTDRVLAEKIIKEIDETLSEGVPSPLLITEEVSNAYCPERRYPVEELINNISPLFSDSPFLLLTEHDIYYADFDYVFGFTDLLKGISVVSLARLGKGAIVEKVVERAVKTAVHEIGHLNGLRHCKNRSCVMSLSFGLIDTDRKDKRFCDRCYKRLLKNQPGGQNETRHTC
ncbi:MAG: hypothetical protein ACK415_07280 [Thermodesulfovibrionales bacterium]